MKKFLALLLLLSATGLVQADPPVVPAEPIKAAVGEDVQVEVTLEKGKAGAYALGFDTTDCLFFRGYSEDPQKMTFLVRPKKQAKFVVIFWTIGEAKSSRLVVDAAGVVPPIPPKPPDPPVPPVPPPSPSPITQPGFRVMIIEESAERTKLPASQAVIATSKRLQDYLRSKTVTDSENKSGAFRIWDKDTDPANDTDPVWTAEALKRPRQSVPWIVIGNHPNGGYEGPLPLTVDATLALLAKVAEAKGTDKKGGRR